MTHHLRDHTSVSFAALLAAGRPVIALLPVGSVEPHGPHLSLLTDVVISEAACVRALALRWSRRVSRAALPTSVQRVRRWTVRSAASASVATTFVARGASR